MDVLFAVLLVVACLAAFAASLAWALSLRKRLSAAAERVGWFEREFGGIVSKAERAQALDAAVAQREGAVQALDQRYAEAEQALAHRYAASERSLAESNEAVKMRFASEESLLAQTHAAALLQYAAADRELKARADELRRQVGALEEQAELQAAGFYGLKYDFASLAQYEKRLEEVRTAQTLMLKEGTAAVCRVEWTVDGNRRLGQKMSKDFLKLILRAFNGTCDTAVARVKFNNVATLERRIHADYEAINKLSESNNSSITAGYLDLKLKELGLVYEFQERKQRDAEEQRAIREQMREEERALKEIERSKDEAEREERRATQALEKARREIEAATGAQRLALEAKLATLTAQLAEASAQKQRAISQAQLTTQGNVYVISNVGAFGEEVYKIGMTRRLDPMDRVIELGDASVPFPFDVHAMMFTENAPELERLLHQQFHRHRLNRVNERREFFRVKLDEIESAARAIAQRLPHHQKRELTFQRTAIAEEYRRSVAIREAEGQVLGAS